MNGAWVLIIDGGPPNDRRPALAFGPFGSEAEAETWRRQNQRLWKDVKGWRTRICPAGVAGDVPVTAP